MPQSYRILHVEDDNEYFELFKTQMQRINGKEGWGSLEFVNVASLDDALELFENGSFDLIISDYQVLKGNGIDFLKNVRERDLSIPFIFLTSQGDEQIARDAFIHGANDYFSKQVGLASYEKIFNAMRSQVDLYNSRRRESEVNRKLYQNEELLINLFESISDFLYYKDPEGRYEIVNKAFEEAVGLKKMDIIGRRDEDIFSKKDAKILGDEGKMVMESMEPMTFENNISLGGGRNYYEILMVPITNGHDNKVRLMGIGRNITKRKMVEESLRKSELLYRTLTENIPNCCLVLYNNALEVVFAGGDSSNNMFKDVKDPASVFWELFEEDTLMALESGFTRALHDVKQSFEIVHESRNFDVYTLPIKNYGGHVELAMAMIYDITERKRTEKELIDQRKELSDYAHIVSHNLKNQLITINAYAQLILEGDEDSPIFAKSLMKTVKKVNEYISGQLKLAEAGRNIGDLREVDLNQLVNRIGKNFLIEIKGNDLPTIMGDPKNIEEVFINLVSNSFKHGKADKVSIYSQIDGEWNRIVFEDNGVGIPDQYVDDIFNLGFSTDGTGFGLAIVKKIIESHGGSIRLLPSNGTGASFEILFPLSNS